MRFTVLFLLLFPFSAFCADTDLDSYRDNARMNYTIYCAGCHQMSGKGTPGLVPDLGEYMGKFAQHPESRPFLAQVPGSSSAPISDAELAQVLNWILFTMNAEQLNEDFTPYSASEVAEYRKTPVLEVIKVRDELVEKVLGDY